MHIAVGLGRHVVLKKLIQMDADETLKDMVIMYYDVTNLCTMTSLTYLL